MIARIALAAALVVTPTFTPTTADVTLTSTLIAMGGTGLPLLPDNTLNNLINVINEQYHGAFDDDSVRNLYTPEGIYTGTYADGEQDLLAALQELRDTDVTVFGVSQSAGIIGMAIRDLAADPSQAPADVHWIALAPPSMPEHGNAIGLAHQPLLESAMAASYPNITETFPTDSPYDTDVYCGMYDPICDAPMDSSNWTTLWNAVAGLFAIHGGYSTLTPDELSWEIDNAQLLDMSTDSTRFYLMPDVYNFGTAANPDYETLLPALWWLTWNKPLYDLLEPVTQVQVDWGYSDEWHTFDGQIVTDDNVWDLMSQAWQQGWDAMVSDLGIEP